MTSGSNTPMPNTMIVELVDDKWTGRVYVSDDQWSAALPLPFTPEADIHTIAEFYRGRGLAVTTVGVTASPRCEYCGGRHEWTHTTRDAIRWGIRRNNLRALSLAFTVSHSE